MNLFNLHPLQMLLNIFGIIICLGVLFSAVCRINVAPVRRFRLSVHQLLYMAMAVWAFGNLLSLVRGEVIEFWDAAAGFAFVLHLYLTYERWREMPLPRPDWEARC